MRNRPPWDDGAPSLRVGWDPTRQEYVIRAPGGHIIGATASLEEVGEAIQFESHWGFGAMELRLQGCKECRTHHGLVEKARTAPSRPTKQKPRPTTINISLEDLGLA